MHLRRFFRPTLLLASLLLAAGPAATHAATAGAASPATADDSAHAAACCAKACEASGRLLFAPLIAPASESRVGFLWHAGEQRLRLDIGNSIDLARFSAGGGRMAVGVDVATWTALRREANFHFPVDAVDYLFGLNASYARRLGGAWDYEARLRFSHISAHMVDGRFDKQAGGWIEDLQPRVYSREYIETVQALRFERDIRVYALAQYIYHVDPPDLRPWALAVGAETLHRGLLAGAVHAFAAYECRLAGTSAYAGNHTGTAGLLIGDADGAAVALYAQGYSGYGEHGEFYDRRSSWWGGGLRVRF